MWKKWHLLHKVIESAEVNKSFSIVISFTYSMASYYVFIFFVVFSNQGASWRDEVDLSVFTFERMNNPYTPKLHVLPVIYMLLTYHFLSLPVIIHYLLVNYKSLPTTYMLLYVTTKFLHDTSCYYPIHVTSSYYSMRTCCFMSLSITYRLGVSYIVTGIEMPILK